MRTVICRVSRASVAVDGQTIGEINRGLLVFAGLLQGDTEADIAWTAGKLAALRIFPDAAGKMNLSVRDVAGSLLLIPNFTLAGDTQKGTRPSYSGAMAPDLAGPMFDRLVALCSAQQIPVATGRFGADMHIDAANDGPVTLVLDSPRQKLET